jgi:hypothetical protein
MESPPKRVTRSRAAAKVAEPAVKTTKIVTASAKARSASTATASTKSTAAKRKTRSDEDELDGADTQQPTLAKRPARGRPRKVVPADEEVSAPAAAMKTTTATRARITKAAAAAPPAAKEQPAPPRPTRGRPKKVVEPKADEAAQEVPPKKTTRGRAVTTTKTTEAATTKPTVKKTVKFEEPDKENLEPSAKTKEPASTGLRGRPVRRAATATTARPTKAAAKSSTDGEKKPLSPRKVTQISVSREPDDSEDELAGEDKTPLLMKSPTKPSKGIAKDTKPEPTATEDGEDSTAVINAAILDPPELALPPITSPARRPPASPFKDTFKSPARKIGTIQLPGSVAKPSQGGAAQPGPTSAFKTSLLHSAAKRPQSPIKGLNFGSAAKPQQTQSAMKSSMFQSPAKRAFPGLKPVTEPRPQHSFNESPLPKSMAASTTALTAGSRPSEKLMLEDEPAHDADAIFSESIEDLEFPGRLSAVLPRHADPAWQADVDAETLVAAEPTEELLVEEDQVDGASTADVTSEEIVAHDEEVVATADTTDLVAETKASPEPCASSDSAPSVQLTYQLQNVQLRETDALPDQDSDFESDEEDSINDNRCPETPASIQSAARLTGTGGKGQASGGSSRTSRRSTLGFTALTDKLSAWSATSPCKPSISEVSKEVVTDNAESTNLVDHVASEAEEEEASMGAHFFEDEMLVRLDVAESSSGLEQQGPAEEDQVLEIDEELFGDVGVTQEDLDLAEEAAEMSLLEPQEIEEVEDNVNHNRSFDDSLSDASQEYGDENQVPVDPAMLGQANQAPTTPVRRPLMATFHTTTKVPLKPADDSTPSPLKKRSFSASRVAPRRPALPRSATVISYSPQKENRRSSAASQRTANSGPSTPAPVTPAKTDIWSTLGTPARTPRRDINPRLLHGAIVYVDVHTSEGSDASNIFIELLTQMGARCVESWDWNPTGPVRDGAGADKIGITHVVYKDGAKEVLDKVRSANGIVSCVGVGWVLE